MVWLLDGMLWMASASTCMTYVRLPMSAANRSEKTVMSVVRRLPRATRPRTPDSADCTLKWPRACLPWTTASAWAPMRDSAPAAAMRPAATESGSREESWAPAVSMRASRPVASSPARSSSATMMKLARRDVPPWLMKGRVTPVSGRNLVTPPTMRNAWKPRALVRPTAAKAEESDLARAAVAKPRTHRSRNSTSTAEEPRRPISSPTAEKMKSDSTTGM